MRPESVTSDVLPGQPRFGARHDRRATPRAQVAERLPPPDLRFPNGMQDRAKFDVIQPLLGDPLTHEPLQAADPLDDWGDGWLASGRREYHVRGCVPFLGLTPSELLKVHGQRAFAAWREVQGEGELSYLQDGPIGNFSHAGWAPAVETGEVLARVFRGQERPWVLDVGCGLLAEPAYQSAAAAAGTRFVGLDPLLGHDERRAPFVVGLGDHLPFRRDALDGVCFISSLDHAINPYRAVCDAWRVLRSGGALVIEETMRPANRNYWNWYFRSFLGPTRFNRFHNFAFRPQSLKRLVRRAGFVALETHVTSDPREMCLVARKP